MEQFLIEKFIFSWINVIIPDYPFPWPLLLFAGGLHKEVSKIIYDVVCSRRRGFNLIIWLTNASGQVNP